MSASKGAPIVNGEDIANYSKVTLADKWWESSGERRGNRARGQTFTTKGVNAYLKAITFQINSEHKAAGGKSYLIRVGKVSGKTH